MSIDGSINLGDVNFTGTPFDLAGVLEPGNLTLGESYLPDYAVDGSLEPPLPLPNFALAGTVVSGNVGDAPLTLPAFTVAGGMEPPLLLPTFALAASAATGTLASGAVVALPFTLAGSLEPPLALPLPAVAGTLMPGTAAQADLILPSFSVAATFGTLGTLTLPLYAVSGDSAIGTVGAGNVLLPARQLTAAGFADGLGDGDIVLQPYSLAGALAGTAVIDGVVTLSAFALAASADTGALGEATLSLPLMTVAADGFMEAIGTADIALPLLALASSLQLGATADNGTPAPDPVAPGATGPTAIVVNTKLKGVTLYRGLAANSFAQFAGVTLAATPAGIVALTGDTDLGQPIAARFASGVTDFDEERLKRVLTGYVGYRAAGELELTLITDQHHEYIYALQPRQRPADLHAARVKFGRGVDGRYWQWAIANRDGADFDLDMLGLHAVPNQRRV